MTDDAPYEIIDQFLSFINEKSFPCVGAKAALAKNTIHCMVAGHMACPKDDGTILQFIYDFTDNYRLSGDLFHSAAIIFREPTYITKEVYDIFLWNRLQSLLNEDQQNYDYDKRVSPDPASPDFSFSLKNEGFFIIGMHPGSERKARTFAYPAIVFNPHAQFEKLKEKNQYRKLKATVRKRDIAFSGSVNPMLDDYGRSSEARQYSGHKYDNTWQCPLKIPHGKSNSNTSP